MGDDKTRFRKENDQFSLRTVLAFNELQTIEGSMVGGEQGDYGVCLFHPEADASTQPEILRKLRTSVRELGECVLESSCHYALFYLFSGELCLVTCGQHAWNGLREGLTSLLERLPIPTTVFSARGGSLRELYGLCSTMQALSSLRIVRGFGSLTDLTKTPEVEADLLRLATLLEAACLSVTGRDEAALSKALRCLSAESELRRAFEKADKTCVARCLSCYFSGINVSSYTAMLASLEELQSTLFRTRPRINRDVVAEARRYAENHYMEQIGINTIAEHLDITPNYLSRLFHERTGKKFVNYLTDIRIENAKRLLRERPGITVKTVAEKVGYLSTRYFTKVFYRKAGKLPSEY
jgi:two-component system response regulator YesN